LHTNYLVSDEARRAITRRCFSPYENNPCGPPPTLAVAHSLSMSVIKQSYPPYLLHCLDIIVASYNSFGSGSSRRPQSSQPPYLITLYHCMLRYSATALGDHEIHATSSGSVAPPVSGHSSANAATVCTAKSVSFRIHWGASTRWPQCPVFRTPSTTQTSS
jgi:hypothetical protein